MTRVCWCASSGGRRGFRPVLPSLRRLHAANPGWLAAATARWSIRGRGAPTYRAGADGQSRRGCGCYDATGGASPRGDYSAVPPPVVHVPQCLACRQGFSGCTHDVRRARAGCCTTVGKRRSPDVRSRRVRLQSWYPGRGHSAAPSCPPCARARTGRCSLMRRAAVVIRLGFPVRPQR